MKLPHSTLFPTHWFNTLALAFLLHLSNGVIHAQAPDDEPPLAPPSTKEVAPMEPIHTVSIGANREFIVNGKPFLPILGWMQNPINFPDIKAAGINTISGYYRPKDGTADLNTADQYGTVVWKNGMYFLPNFDLKYPEEMARIKSAPYLLAWLQPGAPDKIKRKSDAVITSSKLKIDAKRPLNLLTDGDPQTAAYLSPMLNAEVTIRYPKPVTVNRFILGNGADGAKANEVAIFAAGKEIFRGNLPNSNTPKSFALSTTHTVEELTLKIISLHKPDPGKPTLAWGTFAGIDGYNSSDTNVLKCEIRLSPQISGEDALKAYQEAKKFDPNHPFLQIFERAFIEGAYGIKGYSPEQWKSVYSGYKGTGDAYGISIFPIFEWNAPERIGSISKAVQELRATYGKNVPIFQYIETRAGYFEGQEKPITGLEIRNEVYQALASGCTAIGYFTHMFKPRFSSFAMPPENLEAVKKINAEITQITPDLLAPDAAVQPTFSIEGGLQTLCVAKNNNGQITVIAINLDGNYKGGLGTITMPGLKEGTKITIQGENGLIESDEGQWQDTFAPLAVHIYTYKL